MKHREIDVRVHSYVCRLLCHPHKPVGVEELRTRELLFRHLWCRFCDAGKLTKDVEEADLSSDPNRILKIEEGTCIS